MARGKSFLKSTMVSWLATGMDYFSSLIFHYSLGMDSVLSTTMGSILGAVISFYFGRQWAFRDSSGRIRNQAIRFLLVVFMSVFLNSYGVFVLERVTDLPFLYIRIIISTIVGIFFNYFMFRYFVFRR